MAQSRGIDGFGVAVPIADYQRVQRLPGAAACFSSNPYYAALQEVMFQTVRFVRQKSGRNVVVFIHDDDNNFSEMHDLYKNFKEQNPKTAKYMLGFQSMDDKRNPPLQLADMTANLTLELATEWLDDNRSQPKLKEMKQSIEKLGIWTEDYMLALLAAQK